MPTWDPPPVVISRSVTVQDDFEPFHDDPRTDLLTASLGFSRDGKTLTATATLRQPTSPSSRNWWYGYGERRPGIDWHLNLHAETIESDFVAHLRGDPDFGEFGAYGVVTRGFIGSCDGSVGGLSCPYVTARRSPTTVPAL